jgi:hypothetical protein
MCNQANDKSIIRELARQYREVAMQSDHQHTIADWKKLNGLKPARPMIMIDQIPWHEMNVNDELTLYCQDPLLRSLEWNMRSDLYKWGHFPCDMFFYPWLEVPKVFACNGYGLESQFDATESEHQNPQTHTYVDQLPDEPALKKLQVPVYRFDKAATAAREAHVLDLIGDILPVRMTGVSIWAAAWDRIVFWRGATPVLYDLIDRPEFIHKLMSRMMSVEMSMLDSLEEQNLLDAQQRTIHCAGTPCDELPGPDFDPEHVKAKNCWAAGAAQIFSEVSPAMHDEYEIEYLLPYYDRFGLVNYGCCEPLHRKIDIIRRIKNVRSISISPWADVQMASEKIGRDYVMARKHSPSYVAMDSLDEQAIINETRGTLKACTQNGTPCMFILKDITTVRKQPQRLTRWYEIVKTTIDSF